MYFYCETSSLLFTGLEVKLQQRKNLVHNKVCIFIYYNGVTVSELVCSNYMYREEERESQLASSLVGTLSPVNHNGLHQG